MTSETRPRRALDFDLQALRDSLLRMGGLLDRAIEQSMDSLIHRDLDLARQVAAADAGINDPRYRIEEFCLATIAT